MIGGSETTSTVIMTIIISSICCLRSPPPGFSFGPDQLAAEEAERSGVREEDVV